MSPSEFWDSTLCDVLDFIYSRDDFERAKSEERWAIMRRETFYLLNIQIEKQHRLKSEMDLFPIGDEKAIEPDFPFDPKYDEAWEKMDREA